MRTNYGDHLIVDLVDDFSSFGRQAIRRKKYYEKKGYNIKTINIDNYGNKIEFKEEKLDFSKSMF